MGGPISRIADLASWQEVLATCAKAKDFLEGKTSDEERGSDPDIRRKVERACGSVRPAIAVVDAFRRVAESRPDRIDLSRHQFDPELADATFNKKVRSLTRTFLWASYRARPFDGGWNRGRLIAPLPPHVQPEDGHWFSMCWIGDCVAGTGAELQRVRDIFAPPRSEDRHSQVGVRSIPLEIPTVTGQDALSLIKMAFPELRHDLTRTCPSPLQKFVNYRQELSNADFPIFHRCAHEAIEQADGLLAEQVTNGTIAMSVQRLGSYLLRYGRTGADRFRAEYFFKFALTSLELSRHATPDVRQDSLRRDAWHDLASVTADSAWNDPDDAQRIEGLGRACCYQRMCVHVSVPSLYADGSDDYALTAAKKFSALKCVACRFMSLGCAQLAAGRMEEGKESLRTAADRLDAARKGVLGWLRALDPIGGYFAFQCTWLVEAAIAFVAESYGVAESCQLGLDPSRLKRNFQFIQTDAEELFGRPHTETLVLASALCRLEKFAGNYVTAEELERHSQVINAEIQISGDHCLLSYLNRGLPRTQQT